KGEAESGAPERVELAVADPHGHEVRTTDDHSAGEEGQGGRIGPALAHRVLGLKRMNPTDGRGPQWWRPGRNPPLRPDLGVHPDCAHRSTRSARRVFQ